MAETKRTLAAWEQNHQRMLVELPDKVPAKLTAAEFELLCNEHGALGIDPEGRKKWLRRNGHKVNRENMLDMELPPKEEDDG